ncbi:hypothetical protein FJU30_24125 [Affinibrenneria salicis]|uniref:YacC family pilotin-like protein n=1 Tax=Affinibrenneria salicis TaxID=2590031 RepID=A0A5J5FRQ2_9GAMM|nr:YacC family pilotin-like protein [Affinibrenneria salicis]KAA8995479.1 hypothetical protein FJU30_24125 [Affinibrenneria salicis]
MKQSALALFLLSLLSVSLPTRALSEMEADDLADLTAVFIYLKADCGYRELPDARIRQALASFAQQNRWDLTNYNSYDMQALQEDSYRDLRDIAIPTPKKCEALARNSLGLLVWQP